jgi:putative oxidoreductase
LSPATVLLDLSFLNRYEDHALFLLRFGLGSFMCFHGSPVFLGGPEEWAKLGGAVAVIGITGFPAFWGFMAAISLFFGGMFVVVGLGTRICAVFIVLTFLVAAAERFDAGKGLAGAAHALELAIVFAVIVLLGPGRYSIDAKLS